MEPPAVPPWVERLLTAVPEHVGPEAAMELAIGIAESNAEHRGGPFGAVLVDASGRLVALGWNDVIRTHDSTAHAEIVALRRAQAALGTHDLAAAGRGPLTLYTSCAPCIQCFGALYWSGVGEVVAAAPAEAAEAIGFAEGPITPELWEVAARDKGLRYLEGFRDGPAAREPFEVYRRLGGEIY